MTEALLQLRSPSTQHIGAALCCDAVRSHRYDRPSGQMPCQAAAAGVHQGSVLDVRQAAVPRGHGRGAHTHAAAAAAAGAALRSATPMVRDWHLRRRSHVKARREWYTRQWCFVQVERVQECRHHVIVACSMQEDA